ncbi:unnamed protein product [Caenorhabditis auriculariae]|uniref:Uncharacterized protein n=1 Tax=Caenorhabditis auriculariae TaxID=2777116 RepID=A0A8S1GQW2_9PELO|nr:unnamed protein product [Caenorhabditis auriculariae]
MSLSTLNAILILLTLRGTSGECVDSLPSCSALQPICMGSVIIYQLKALASLADQVANSTALPALENKLPLLNNDVPLVSSSNGGATTQKTDSIEQKLIDSLPLLQESLPLIRESLPLIRESLPLIRQYLDPLFESDKSTCQQKATCKSCRDCPQLRQQLVSFVEALCPATCKVCDNTETIVMAASDLASAYV